MDVQHEFAGSWLSRAGLRLSEWFERWFPDAFALALVAVLIVFTGYSVATAPLVYRVVCRIAEVPRTPRGAVAFVAMFSMLSSLISWSFSLIISGLLAREVTHRVKGA